MYVFETKTTFFHDQKNNKEKKYKNKHSLYKHNLTRTMEHRFIRQLVFNGSINKTRSLSFFLAFSYSISLGTLPGSPSSPPSTERWSRFPWPGVLFPSVRSHSSPLGLSCSARCAVCLARALLRFHRLRLCSPNLECFFLNQHSVQGCSAPVAHGPGLPGSQRRLLNRLDGFAIMTAEDSATKPATMTTPNPSSQPACHPQQPHTSVPEGVAGAPNEAALVALMERTGYGMVQENGQRKYGPPPGWDGHAPPRGCEIFVGKIPRDVYEDELVPVFESVGRIYEMRLMMDFDGKNRGYAFVMYTQKQEAKRAVRELNNYEVRPGRLLGVCCSVDNCRLFIGGIPKTKKREEILEEVSKVTEGVLDVIVYASAADKMKNRGFAFVEYESHRAAAMARRKLMPGRIQLWGHQIAVDWAEPEIDVDEDVMETVKILYVRNLMIETSEETLRQVFGQFNPGCVERVKKIRDYAFVHFANRGDAVLAMDNLNGTEVEGSCIEVTLAKPVDKEQYTRYQKAAKGTTPAPETPQTNYIYQCDPYTLTYYGYPYNALIGPNREYFIKGAIRGRGRAASGSRAAGPRGSYLGGYSAGRGIYSRYHEGKAKQQDKPYELVPSLELAAVNPVGIKPGAMTLPTLGGQYPMFSSGPAAKLLEEGKMHAVEHLINPLAMQHDHSTAAAAATAAVLPAVSTPPPFQGRPITPVYAMAHNVQRIPTAAAAAGLYGAGYGASYAVPIAAPTTATLAALQKNAAVAAAAYGAYAGYMPQAFPAAAAFQVPIHDIYQTY